MDFDLGGGKPDGLEIHLKVQAWGDRPVIMLTSNNSVETLVSCLSAGADQYMIKPCEIRELVARVKVTLRNCRAANCKCQLRLKSGSMNHED